MQEIFQPMTVTKQMPGKKKPHLKEIKTYFSYLEDYRNPETIFAISHQPSTTAANLFKVEKNKMKERTRKNSYTFGYSYIGIFL